MKFAEKFLKKFKRDSNSYEDFIKEIPENVIKTIESKAIEKYIASPEFEQEVSTIVKSLGDEWYNQYKEKNTKETTVENYNIEEYKQYSLDDFNKDVEAEMKAAGFGKEFPKNK